MKRHTLASAIAASLFGLSHPAAASALIENSKATLDTRNFYFNQDNRSGDAAPSYGEEWGQGFLLNFQSGYTEGAVGLGFDAIAQLGIRLDSGGRTSKADRSRNPGNLFPLDSNGRAADEFSRIDFAAKARIANTELRYGALQPKLPVLTYNDGRLLPQTFRGAQISSGDIDKLKLTVGEIRQASGRASSDYDDLRIAGGSERVDRFRYAGGDYVLTENLTTSYYFAELKDYQPVEIRRDDYVHCFWQQRSRSFTSRLGRQSMEIARFGVLQAHLPRQRTHAIEPVASSFGRRTRLLAAMASWNSASTRSSPRCFTWRRPAAALSQPKWVSIQARIFRLSP